MSQIPCKQSKRIEMTGWFKHCFPSKLCLNIVFPVNEWFAMGASSDVG